MRSMQWKVVSTVNDKTVAVEVVRLAPHSKYKMRVTTKKKYQSHDPENQFQVGDIVQLEKSRPISKTKTFVAVAVRSRVSKKVEDDSDELGIPLESEQQQEMEEPQSRLHSSIPSVLVVRVRGRKSKKRGRCF